MKKKLPRSIRKYIRFEKSRIRREVFDAGVEERLIRELYERFLPRKKKMSEEVLQEKRQSEKREHRAIQVEGKPRQRKKQEGEKKKSKIVPKMPTKSKPKPLSRSKKVTKKKAPEDS